MSLRLITAMVTPFTKDLELDLPRAALLARRLTGDGSDGIVVAGTTGESPTLTGDEKDRLLGEVLAAVGHQTEVWANTGTYDTRASVRATERAERLGAHGVMAVVPYYSRPSPEGLYRHFRAIAESTPLPVLLYNVPSRTAQNMRADTVLRLMADCPNICGVKEASGDLTQAGEILRGRRSGFLVLSGDDKMTLPLLSIGGDGVVSVVSHVAGPEMRRLLDVWEQGRQQAAMELHLQLLPLFTGLFVVSNPVPVKEALRMTGFDTGPVRPPLAPLTEGERRLVTEILASRGALEAAAAV